MATRSNPNFILSGRITNRQAEPLAGMVVRAYRRTPKNPSGPLGSPAVTDAGGRYKITLPESAFKTSQKSAGPELFVRVYNGENQLSESAIKRGAGKRLTINLELDSAPADSDRAAPRQRLASDLELDSQDTVMPAATHRVFGVVRNAQGDVLPGITVQAFNRSLRAELALGSAVTDAQGLFQIQYTGNQFQNRARAGADVVVKALASNGTILATSAVLFNAAQDAELDVVIPANALPPPPRFEKIGRTLTPMLGPVPVADLENQDVGFLAGATDLNPNDLARFALAHKLATPELPVEFWFAVLGSSIYDYNEQAPLAQQMTQLLAATSSLDTPAVRAALARSFNQTEISPALQQSVDKWTAAFSSFVAKRLVSAETRTFAKSALDLAGVRDANKQQNFARLFNQYRALTPDLVQQLEKTASFSKAELADLQTSFRLADVTQGDFSLVQAIRQQFGVRQPEQIQTLAKKSESEWVSFVTKQQAAGAIQLPVQAGAVANGVQLPAAEVYGKLLERQFREAFPTAAFAGGLQRALQNGGAPGLPHAQQLGSFLDSHTNFELLKTPVDEFLNKSVRPEFQRLAQDRNFRLELKAAQRVFKLAPTFEATNALLAANLQSAQQIYRLGESAFVKRYGGKPGLTPGTARTAWNRAADAHAAALTIVGDVRALDGDALPRALQTGTDALSTFPTLQNLFQTGDLCECEDCRSVLSPAAYFADLVLYLRDRAAKNPAVTVKDILFRRRPDLGWLELSCDNAQTTLPYIDVVCEVLEDVIAAGENVLPLPGLSTIPTKPDAARAAVKAAFAAQGIRLDDEFVIAPVDPADPDRWVAHDEAASYLLKKNAGSNFVVETLRNTHASSQELRAYPRYVNPTAYQKLRAAKYPIALPFDLFDAEVRAAFQKSNLERWDLMRTLRGTAAPYNPGDAEIAAAYFNISVDASAAFDEKRLILVADPTVQGQQAIWGESGANWLDKVSNVNRFLGKTALEYNDLLGLLDLKFINPAGEISINRSDPSCDTDKQTIQGLDAAKLDRIHRFLRLWRKLDGWKMWELDLVLRHPHIGGGALDESLLTRLFYFSRLKKRLGSKITVEQVAGLFGNLNTATRFTKLHDKRADALYQTLFLNKQLINPLDPAFQLDPGTGELPTGETITAHRAPMLGALGIREADLKLFLEMTKAPDGTRYINDDLTLANLSFLWRYAWLARILKLGAQELKILLELLRHDVTEFRDPQAAWAFVETVDEVKRSGFTPDELAWVLAADRSAKSALSESNAARFLTALRKELESVRAANDPAQFPFLTASPPTDIDQLSALLSTLLQKLNRDETETQFFIATLRDEASVETTVTGLPAGFNFPAAIGDAIRIRYAAPTTTLRFTGLMTDAERTKLLTDPSLSTVTGIPAYQEAIKELYRRPRLALKFYEPSFATPLAALPPGLDFTTLTDAALSQKIFYDAAQRVLRFAGILSQKDHAALVALSNDAPYRSALDDLASQPGLVTPPDERIWLTDSDLQLPLRDLNVPANDHLAENLAAAAKKGLTHLSKTLAENAVVQKSAAELGLDEEVTRFLLTRYPLLPETLMTHLTGAFAATTGVVDYATLKPTFDAWSWASRVARLLGAWKLTPRELEQMDALKTEAQLLDLLTLPHDMTQPSASLDSFLRTSRLFRLRDSLPEIGISLMEVLAKLKSGGYASVNAFAVDVERLNDAWGAADVQGLVASFDLAYPADYMLAENWERLRRAFYYIETLNAGSDIVKTFAAATMTDVHTKTLHQLLRAKLGTEVWLSLSTEIQDVLRERKRDALAAFLLAGPQPADAPTGKWETTNDLYAYYLLDVEMSSCQLTSRLVQASGSVQLFVQRCMMGLEPEVQVQADGAEGDSAWRWWKWMRKYRVWEANRKVFLYPENWIEPELKQDRSEFFKELESELLQNDVTQATVETALQNYLGRLDGVAQLELAGFYQEDDGDEALIHTFGRTVGAEPHLYYYRRYDYRQWTPWEKIELDIQGDYLVPAVMNKRLFLFWPVFSEVNDEAGNSTFSTPGANQSGVRMQRASKKLRLQMAVSEYRQGKWSPRRTSKEAHESSAYPGELRKKFYRFFLVDRSEIDGRFGIKYEGWSIDSNGWSGWAPLVGSFEMSDCKGVPEKGFLAGTFKPAIRPEAVSTGSPSTLQKWVELGGPDEFERVQPRYDVGQDDFTLQNVFADPNRNPLFTTVLNRTPQIFKMSPAWHTSYPDKLLLDEFAPLPVEFRVERPVPLGTWLPFFYNDPKRTFFVLPVLTQAENSTNGGGGARMYYPNVKEMFRRAEDYFAGQAQTWLDAFKLAALTPEQRQQLEKLMSQRYPWEVLPPYSDEQLKRLIKKYFMRFFHTYLGTEAAQLFSQRRFHFKNFYHPFTCEFINLVSNPLKGVSALMSRETQLNDSGFRFAKSYEPTGVVLEPDTENNYPREMVDFSPDGAYASYNWELFYHAPLLVANALSKNQRFEEAREWYHFIFNPIGTESEMPGGSPVSKYWITKPFFETTHPQYLEQRIEKLLQLLAGDTSAAGAAEETKQALQAQLRDWRTHPFEPHRIAAYRTVAYQKTVVMKYLDNLIAWGDNLFRQDSIESINEATQLYILAAEILGPRPRNVPPHIKPPVQTFNELEFKLDTFSNALTEVENLVPPLAGNETNNGEAAPLPTLYFCIPQNDKLLGYWDTVADRLFKIRHCMNIEGAVRQLALFEPPIDPGALVKAVAAGADLGAALGDLNAALPPYRFSTMLQKANEVCNDVKVLGGALLGVLERKDAEELSLLRQHQEITLLDAIRAVRENQINEIKENLAALVKSKEIAQIKKQFYSSREFLNGGEKAALALSATALVLQTAGTTTDILGSVLAGVPDFTAGVSGLGSPHVVTKTGGSNFSKTAELVARSLYQGASLLDKYATVSTTVASYQRRQDDWDLQANLADKEVGQLERSIAAAELRQQLAEKELENHLLQIENAKETETFMRTKYTNQELFQWQVGQVSGVFFSSYQLAYDLAKRAERCFRFELGLQDRRYINFGYWDSLKKGLLAGEKLQYDLRRLESAYLEQNRREFELVKHVSLLQLDPLALVQLRETGRCFFRLPEEMLDLDYPGHYMRRIKSVSLTIPCVVGPYTTISCTLRLLKNSIRINTANGDDGYPRNRAEDGVPTDDARFVESNLPAKAIATSNAQNDSGIFELSFRDERYLPFEGAGAISEWSLELFHDPGSDNSDFGKPLRQFDYDTITDAILHMKYTAREDAGAFKNAAIAHLRDYFTQDGASPGLRLFDLRQEFPSEWYRFLHPANPANGNVLTFEMSPELFPIRDAGKTLQVNTLSLLARCSDAGNYTVVMTPPLPEPPPPDINTFTLAPLERYGGLHSAQKDTAALGIEVVPTAAPLKWQLTMTRPGGGMLEQDPVTKVLEVSELMLIVGYEWQ